MPVITPYELELGLGAREWDTTYLTSANSTCMFVPTSLNTGDSNSSCVEGGEKFAVLLQRVKDRWAHSRSSSEDAADIDIFVSTDASNRKVDSSSEHIGAAVVKAEDQLTVFASPAAAYLSGREFKGLDAAIPIEQTTDIQPGVYGIATDYKLAHNQTLDSI